MRHPTDVTLDSVIIHRLDTRPEASPDIAGLRFSKALLPFRDDPALEKYLTTHIIQSLDDTAAQAATFKSIEAEAVSGICGALHGNQATLVDGSKAIAEHLYHIMERDRRIKAGVLAACFYVADERVTTTRYLALLKIDLGDIFRTKTIVDDDGNEIISLEVDQNAVTSTRERLQKSAFIRPLDPRSSDYDMLLLDRQVRPDRRANADASITVAKFFMGPFLDARPTLDDRERTRRFYRSVLSAQDTLQELDQLDAAQYDALSESVEVALTAITINVETWVENLPLTPDAIAVVRRFVASERVELEFSPDQEYVRQIIRRRRYTGAHGLRISVESPFAKQIIRSVNRRSDGGRRYYEVVIHTDSWNELPE